MMLVDGVFGIEETFDLGDRKGQGDPIFGRVVFAMGGVNAILREPVLDHSGGLIRRSEEIVNLLL